MPFNHIEIENEIKALNQKIITKRKMLDESFRAKVRFSELKKIHSEIKELDRKLEFCLEEARVMKTM